MAGNTKAPRTKRYSYEPDYAVAPGETLQETAIRLERVTGVPAGMWNNLEANYREQLARLDFAT